MVISGASQAVHEELLLSTGPWTSIVAVANEPRVVSVPRRSQIPQRRASSLQIRETFEVRFGSEETSLDHHRKIHRCFCDATGLAGPWLVRSLGASMGANHIVGIGTLQGRSPRGPTVW